MILLTGATGFLGGYMLREFTSRGEKVRALVRNPEKVKDRQSDGVEWIEGDVLDTVSLERAIEGCEYVVHGAAVVSFWKKRYREMQQINVNGTENMVNIALAAGVKRFVHISSIAAIGRSLSHPKVTEDTPWLPDSPFNTGYAKTKRMAELEIQRGVMEGLPAVMVNPGIILGAAMNGDWQNGSPALFSKMKKGFPFYPKGGSGFVSAKDVATAAAAVIRAEKQSGERFILVSDNWLFKELFEKLAMSVGVHPPRRKVPYYPARLLGWLSENFSYVTGKEPLINRETTLTSALRWEFDGSRICREFDFAYSDLGKEIEAVGKLCQ